MSPRLLRRPLFPKMTTHPPEGLTNQQPPFPAKIVTDQSASVTLTTSNVTDQSAASALSARPISGLHFQNLKIRQPIGHENSESSPTTLMSQYLSQKRGHVNQHQQILSLKMEKNNHTMFRVKKTVSIK